MNRTDDFAYLAKSEWHSALQQTCSWYLVISVISVKLKPRGGTIPEITMRYVSRYLGHDTICITILH